MDRNPSLLSTELNYDDPEALLLDERVNGEFITGEDGYDLFKPTPTTLRLLETLYKQELDVAYLDSEEERSHKLKLLRAAEGIVDAKGKKPLTVLPIVKRIVNQVVAWTKNTIMQRRPLVTVEPDAHEEFQVLMPSADGSFAPLTKTSEDLAQSIEQWLEYKLRKKIDFDRFIEVACIDAQQGQTPTWAKVVHNKQYRAIKTYKPQIDSNGKRFIGKEEDLVLSGEPNQILNISTYNMLMPADEQDEQESRWIAESCPKPSSELRKLLYSQETYVKKDEREELIRKGLTSPMERRDMQAIASLDKRSPSSPLLKHDIWELWFRRWLNIKNADTGAIETKEFELCGLFHRTLGRFLYIYRNPFDHGKRPYVAIFHRKKPHRHSGGSTCEDVLPFQTILSQLISLEIRNAIKAVTQVVYARPGSSSHEWLQENSIEPGSIIPRDSKDDVEALPFGEQMNSLINLMEFSNQEVEKLTQIGDLQLGLEIPGRTPVGTVQQVMNSGATQAAMFLDTFRRDISKVIQMYVQTCQQFSRLSERIPFSNPETREMLNIFLGFPLEAIHDQFSFSITASSDDQTNQAKFQQAMMMINLLDQDNLSAAQMIGPMLNQQMPPSAIPILKQEFNRKQKLLKRLFNLISLDGESYTISPQMLDQALIQQQMQMQQQPPQQPQPGGGPPANQEPSPIPNGGSPVPNGPDSGGGLGGPGEQLGLSGSYPRGTEIATAPPGLRPL